MAIQLLTVCILFTGAFGRSALLPQPYPHKSVNYGFTYGVKDSYSGTDYARQEEGIVGSNPNGGNNVMGSYHVLLPDGRLQLVTYKADENGYRAEVTYKGEAHHQPSLPHNPYSSAHVHHQHHKPAPTPPAAYNPLSVPYSPTVQHHLPAYHLPAHHLPAHHLPVHHLPAHHFQAHHLPAHHLPAHHLHTLPLHPLHSLPFQYAPRHHHSLPIPLEGASGRLPANTYHLGPHPLATTEAPAAPVIAAADDKEFPDVDVRSILNVPVIQLEQPIEEVEPTENEDEVIVEAVVAEESEESSEEETSEVVTEAVEVSTDATPDSTDTMYID